MEKARKEGRIEKRICKVYWYSSIYSIIFSDVSTQNDEHQRALMKNEIPKIIIQNLNRCRGGGKKKKVKLSL
jgi:hypothetical protein